MLVGPRSERRDRTQVEADLSGLDGHVCLLLTVGAPWPGPDPHGRPFSTACGLHIQPLRLPASDSCLGVLPPPPPWMAAGLTVVTLCGMSPSSGALRGGRRSSRPTWQGLCHSVSGPTRLGGSFGQGGPPEGKQVGALTFPEGGLQQSAEESGRKGTSQTARPHRVKNLACA